jgi:hypothetical protein
MAARLPSSTAAAHTAVQDGAKLAAWVAKQTADAPPLSEEQRRALSALLNQPPMPPVVTGHGRPSKRS